MNWNATLRCSNCAAYTWNITCTPDGRQLCPSCYDLARRALTAEAELVAVQKQLVAARLDGEDLARELEERTAESLSVQATLVKVHTQLRDCLAERDRLRALLAGIDLEMLRAMAERLAEDWICLADAYYLRSLADKLEAV